MRNPINYYKELIDQVTKNTTNQIPLSSQDFTDEEIQQINDFTIDFFVKQ